MIKKIKKEKKMGLLKYLEQTAKAAEKINQEEVDLRLNEQS